MKLILPDGREIEVGINVQDLPPGTKLETRIERVPTTTINPNGYCDNQQEFQKTCAEVAEKHLEKNPPGYSWVPPAILLVLMGRFMWSTLVKKSA